MGKAIHITDSHKNIEDIAVTVEIHSVILSFKDIYYCPIEIPRHPIKDTLHPPRIIVHGCQIVYWDPQDAKQRCPQNILVWAM